MKISFWPLAVIFYTDRMPDWSGGITQLFVIRIRPEYKDDEGLEAHEMLHVSQFWRLAWLGMLPWFIWAGVAFCTGNTLSLTEWAEGMKWLNAVVPISIILFFLHPHLYTLSKRYREWSEVAAYREQLKHPPAKSNPERYAKIFCHALAAKYKLNKDYRYFFLEVLRE